MRPKYGRINSGGDWVPLPKAPPAPSPEASQLEKGACLSTCVPYMGCPWGLTDDQNPSPCPQGPLELYWVPGLLDFLDSVNKQTLMVPWGTKSQAGHWEPLSALTSLRELPVGPGVRPALLRAARLQCSREASLRTEASTCDGTVSFGLLFVQGEPGAPRMMCLPLKFGTLRPLHFSAHIVLSDPLRISASSAVQRPSAA